MKTNGILTLSPFKGKPKLKKSFSRVFDKDGALIGGVSAYNVYDLNGTKIASLARVIPTEGGEMRRYEGFRNFHLNGGYLMLENGSLLGRVEVKKDRSALVPVFSVLGVVLAAVLIIVCILGFPAPTNILPGDAAPELILESDEEQWSAEEDLKIFPGTIMPGSEGVYEFKVINPTDYQLLYTLTLTDERGWGEDARSPIVYRIRMNDAYILGDEDEWISLNEMQINIERLRFDANSSHIFIIEWQWPFMSGNDEADTDAGIAHAVYRLNVKVTATLYEGEGQIFEWEQ